MIPHRFHKMPTSWGYQLQNADSAHLKNVPYDVIVLDMDDFMHSNEGVAVSAIRFKPDGERREVISYVSIGEAEDYRWYWDIIRQDHPPSWLLSQNPEWKGNYAVAFWDTHWQAFIFKSVLRAIDLGYDGVYLDKCDVMHDILTRHPNIGRSLDEMKRSMISFICKIASVARRRVPGFRIIMQNAEDLLDVPEGSKDLLSVLSGVAKEDLLIGAEETGVPNSKVDIEWSLRRLSLARVAGLPVFVVEYTDFDGGELSDLVQDLSLMGFIPYISPSDRALDRMPINYITGGKF